MLEIILKKKKKLKLASVYPYTYARVAVMRSKLLKGDQYNQLLKMSLPEIARFLQSGIYKEDIDALALKLSGTRLIDAAVHKNMGTIVNKLKKISEGNLKIIIETYLQRRDNHNAKTLIRGIISNFQFEKIQFSLMEGGSLKTKSYKELYENKDIMEILKTLRFLTSKQANEIMIGYQKDKDLFKLENKFDANFYNYIINFTNSLPKQGKIMKEFLLKEIEITNIMTLLRLKREKIENKDILPYLFFQDQEQKKFFKRLLEYDETERIIDNLTKALQDRKMRKAFESYKKDGSLSSIEISLSKYLLKRTVLSTHQNPISIDVILAYLFALEIEAKNISIIAKAKESNIPEDQIKELLVI